MRKVLTIHDVFHLTRPDFYTSGKFITGRVVDSLKIDMDSVAFDSAYSMEDFRQLVGRLPRKSKVVHLAVDQSFRHPDFRSEEHTSELQSLMRNSYAVFCLKQKNIYQQ